MHCWDSYNGGLNSPRKGPFMVSLRSALCRLAVFAVIFGLGVFALPAGAADSLPSASVKHPAVADKETDYRLAKKPEEQKALAEEVLAMDLDTLLGYIGTDNGIYFQFTCPKCGGKVKYSLEHPDALTCAKCGAVITEKDFPPNKEVEGTGPKGDHIVFRYSQKGYKLWPVVALMHNLRHQKIAEAARALGRRYCDTGDEKYAARAVAILDKFAQVYPRWPVVETQHFPRPAKFIIQPDRPYDHWVHVKWRHSHNYDVPYDLTFAYDFVYNAKEWKKRPGARERVENDLLRGGYRHAWTVHEDMGEQVNNLTGTLIASTILLGRTLGDPDMVHRAVYTLQEMLRVFYHFDGMEYEGALTYHGTVTGRAAIAERMLAGYLDPRGYKDAKYGIVLDGVSLRDKIPVYKRAWNFWKIMKLPNGRNACVHDSDWSKRGDGLPADAPIPDYALNAYGHYALGRGKGLRGVQAHLHFCPFSQQSHYHQDRPQIILYGAGQELLSDIGYVHMRRKHRYFANSSISHNTVTVEYDKKPARAKMENPDPSIVGTVERPKAKAILNREKQDSRATLVACDWGLSNDEKVQVVACSVPDAPRMGLKHRTRELLVVALDDERSCVVDIFRIQGGTRHNFVLKPSSDEDVATEAISLALGEERPGTLAGEDLKYDQRPRKRDSVIPYSWLVHKIRTASAAKDWSMSWLGKDSGARLRVFMAGMGGAELWLGQSPTMRRANNNDKQADDFQNPHAIVRRADPGRGNTFVAVYEPVAKGDEPVIRDVHFQVGENAGLMAPVAIRIATTDGRTIAVDARVASADGIEAIAPTYSIASKKADGSPLWSYEVGKRSRYPLKKVLRIENGDPVNGFIVGGRLPKGALKAGEWVRLVYGGGRAYGYQVAKVQPEGTDTRIEITGEPGFAYDGKTMSLLYYPFYETPGVCEIEIAEPVYRAAGN